MDNATGEIYLKHNSLCHGDVRCHGIVKVNENGDALWVDTTTNQRAGGNGVFIQDSILFLSFRIAQDTLPFRSVIRKLHTKNGSWIGDCEYSLYQPNEYLAPIGPSNNGAYVTLMYDGDNADTARYLFINNDCTIRHERYYLQQDTFGRIGPRQAMPWPDGGLVGGATEGKYPLLEGRVTRLDSTGQVVWQTVLPDSSCYKPDWQFPYLARLPDDRIAAYWEYKSCSHTGPPRGAYLYILEPDSGQIVKSIELNKPGQPIEYTGMAATPDGRVVFCGYESVGSVTGFSTVAIARAVDTSGAIVFDRHYFDYQLSADLGDEGYSEFNDVGVLPNGDLVFVGDARIPPQPGVDAPFDGAIYLVRTDSLGCLEPGCADGDVILTDTREPVAEAPLTQMLHLYPNPAAAALNIELSGHSSARADYRMFDGQGRLLRRWTDSLPATMEVADLRPGLYLLQVRTREGGAVGRFLVGR